MRRSRKSRVLLAAGVLLGWLATAVAPSEAAEEAWRFLEGLRERGYYDVALDYLDQIETSPRCPADLKEVIDYEAGVTLVNGSRLIPSMQAREKQLDEARDRFQKFLAAQPKHDLAGNANSQLANVLVERGRMRAEAAARPTKTAAEKAALMEEARKQYIEAQKVFQAAEKRAYEKAKALQGTLDPKKDADKIEERDKARADLVQARLFLAQVLFEIGKTYPADKKEFKEKLKESAEKYHHLYANYGSLGAGLYARMWEGRVYKELGETDKAIEVFKEMLTLPDRPDTFRTLKNQSLILLLETYQKAKRYPDAIAAGEVWTKSARPAEESTPDGLKIHFLIGNASLEYAKSLEKDDPKRSRENGIAAKKHLEFVSRFAGEFRREANSSLRDPLFGKPPEADEEPETYADAKDRGDFAWGTMVLTIGKLQQAKTKEDQDKFTKQMNASRNDAIKYLRMAIGMKTEETPVVELNLMRYRLTYLYWASQDLYKSALLGEFLARKYPQSAGARKGAEIAVKAYRMLFTQARKLQQDSTFETARMASVAEYITTRWEGEPEADEAWMMLIDTAVDNRDLDKALEYLGKVSPDSPRRGQAELRTGQALWASYVAAANREEADRPSAAELDTMIKQAQDTLQQGIARMRESVDEGGAVDYTLVYSVLSLSQIFIDSGQAEEAVKWLDDPKVGPMTLIAAKNPVTEAKKFQVDTLKAAMRAYVGAQELDKAEQAMSALEELVATDGDAKAGESLTQIYIRLGRELQELLTRLRNENKQEELDRVSKGFELFLTKISQRDEGNTFSSLNWVAETFFNLGAGLDPGGKETPVAAKEYYKKAAATYLKILKACKEEGFAPAGASDNIKVRLAACLRALGEHEESMKLLIVILQEKERRLDVQIEAARTYQDWGQVKSGYYEKAIKGGHEEDGRYLIWGWGGISRKVGAFEKYRSIFHEARYNLARCRWNLAKAQSGTQRTETLKKALLDITRVFQLYPQMGGEEWYPKYDSLLKTIQKTLDPTKKATGLKGLPGATARASK